jgi:hypothetical protein
MDVGAKEALRCRQVQEWEEWSEDGNGRASRDIKRDEIRDGAGRMVEAFSSRPRVGCGECGRAGNVENVSARND